MGKSDQAAFSKYFRNQAIHYQPGFGIIFGVKAGLLLSQLLFWHGKGAKKPWTYKTIEELRLETGLSRTEQQTAIKALVRLGILELTLKGVPAKRHFKIDIGKLHELLPSLKKTYKLNYPNPPTYYVQNEQTITKTTRENTTKKQTPSINKNNWEETKRLLAEAKSIRPP